jgi:hypothetical protein
MTSSALGYAVAPRVTRVDVLEPYRLSVAFMDGSEQSIDLAPLSQSKWFGPLRDPAVFKQVVIDPHGSLLWPNHAMLPLWTLHDWPTAGASFVADVQNRERGERRHRVFQKLFTAATALWLLGYVASWAGWIGGEPVSLRDLTFPAVILTQNVGQLVIRRSAVWGGVLILASLVLMVALLLANIALR